MLSQCWASVVDGGPPLTKHRVNASLFSGWDNDFLRPTRLCILIIYYHVQCPIKTPHPYESRTWIQSL